MVLGSNPSQGGQANVIPDIHTMYNECLNVPLQNIQMLGQLKQVHHLENNIHDMSIPMIVFNFMNDENAIYIAIYIKQLIQY